MGGLPFVPACSNTKSNCCEAAELWSEPQKILNLFAQTQTKVSLKFWMNFCRSCRSSSNSEETCYQTEGSTTINGPQTLTKHPWGLQTFLSGSVRSANSSRMRFSLPGCQQSCWSSARRSEGDACAPRGAGARRRSRGSAAPGGDSAKPLEPGEEPKHRDPLRKEIIKPGQELLKNLRCWQITTRIVSTWLRPQRNWIMKDWGCSFVIIPSPLCIYSLQNSSEFCCFTFRTVL